MRYGNWGWLVAVAVLCPAVLCAAGARALGVDIDSVLTPENRKLLDAGKAVVVKNKSDDSGAKVISHSTAMVVVNKPVEGVWPYLVAFEKFPEFIPRLLVSEKYAEHDGLVGIRQMLKVMWEKVEYHVLQKNDEAAHTMTFHLDKTQKNDVAETDGQWVLRPYGEGKCLAVYSLALDTGMPVPRFIQTMLLNDDLPATMLAIKQRVETNGEYKKK